MKVKETMYQNKISEQFYYSKAEALKSFTQKDIALIIEKDLNKSKEVFKNLLFSKSNGSLLDYMRELNDFLSNYIEETEVIIERKWILNEGFECDIAKPIVDSYQEAYEIASKVMNEDDVFDIVDNTSISYLAELIYNEDFEMIKKLKEEAIKNRLMYMYREEDIKIEKG